MIWRRFTAVVSACAPSALLAALAACQARVTPVTEPFTGYRWLVDGSYHASTAPPPTRGFYVLGRLEGLNFVAVTEVEGEGELGEAGTSGWLELSDGSFHATLPTAPPPSPPYIQGFTTLDGEFAPSSRRVLR